MPNFEFRKVEAVAAREDVLQLFIDDEGQLDEFEKEVKDQYARHFNKILYILEQAANGTILAKERFHPYKTPKSIKLKCFECKSDDLRLYITQIPGGKLIVLGGLKNRQKKDFRRFESLIEQIQDLPNLT